MPPNTPISQQNATLIRLPDRAAAWLEWQADELRRKHGRHVGKGPVAGALVEAASILKLDFTDAQNYQELVVKAMRLFNARLQGGK